MLDHTKRITEVEQRVSALEDEQLHIKTVTQKLEQIYHITT